MSVLKNKTKQNLKPKTNKQTNKTKTNTKTYPTQKQNKTKQTKQKQTNKNKQTNKQNKKTNKKKNQKKKQEKCKWKMKCFRWYRLNFTRIQFKPFITIWQFPNKLYRYTVYRTCTWSICTITYMSENYYYFTGWMSDGSSISRWHFKLIITQTYSIIDVIITQLFLLTSSLCWPDKNRNIGIAYSFVYISIIFLIYLGLLFTSLFDVFSFYFQCNAVTTTYNINFHKYKILNHRYHRYPKHFVTFVHYWKLETK